MHHHIRRSIAAAILRIAANQETAIQEDAESTLSVRGENHAGETENPGEQGILNSPIVWTVIVLILSGLGIFRELL